MRRWIAAMASLFALGAAHAEELVLSNGDHWSVNGTILHRSEPAPPLDVTMSLYSIGIGCETGLKASANADKPAYLPPGFYPRAVEQPDEGDEGAFATVCADLPRGVLVADLQWKGELAAANAAAFRDLLEYLAAALVQNPPLPASALPLFNPPTVSVALDARTGVWNYVRDRTTATVALLVPLWPKASIVLQLQRSENAQQCGSVGFGTTTPRPTWAPDTFYAYGAHRDGAGFACFDGPSGRLIMFSLTETHLNPDDVQRVAALLAAIATGLRATPELLPPSTSATPAPAAPTAP